MRYRVFLIACLLWPGSALPDTWSGMASKILGVEFLSLRRVESGSYVGFLDGESEEFLTHCTGGGLVHVSGLTAPVKCQMGDPGVRGEFFQIMLMTKEPLRGSGPFVMSKKPIPPRTQLFDFSTEESNMLKTADRRSLSVLDKSAFNCYRSRSKEADENGAKIDRQVGRAVTTRTTTYKQDHERYVRDIKASAQYKKFIGKKFKISGPNGFFYISSIGLESCDLMGWDIVNVVYVQANDVLIQMTRFHGCIEGGFRDLNGDGVPEVLTHTCENSESSASSYWTINPQAKVLLQH
jgi:hypothetical protein